MVFHLSDDQQQRLDQFCSRHRTSTPVFVGVMAEGMRGWAGGLLDETPKSELLSSEEGATLIVTAEASSAALFALRAVAALRGKGPRLGIHAAFSRDGKPDAAAAVALLGLLVEMAQPGQILLTQAAFDSARATLRPESEQVDEEGARIRWHSHGAYRMREARAPIALGEVGVEGGAPFKAPADSETAHRHHVPGIQPVLGWRPGLSEQIPTTNWILEEFLGEGLFGETWRARGREGDERRVFKFCFRAERVLSLKSKDAEFRVLQVKLRRHPNILGILGTHFESEPHWIEMDPAPSPNLMAWCEAAGGLGSVPLESRVEIVAQVAQALEAAHRDGVLHCDIKPANIFVAGSPEDPRSIEVLVADFGIGDPVAREVLGAAGEVSGGTEATEREVALRTQARLRMDPAVMAGGAMEPAADIYALGVLLYQMVAGDLRRPLPDGEVRAPEDWILDGVIQRCTAPLRTERFLTAGEVASRLRGMSDQRAKFRWAIVFGVAAVVIAFALVQWLWPTGVLLVPLDENTVIEMRRIRGGEFSMGSSDSEPGREANEGPVHSVSVSPIHLGTAEVTVGQYRLFLEETAHPEPPDWEEQLQYPDFPVVWVSWDDAQAFCQWLTQRESAAFALPTEAQWEFACRAGASSAFAFGETLSPGQENYFELPDEFSSEQLASPEATDGPAMLPSGAGAANGWGLIDMHGNVSEWCRDWYSPEFYSAANASGTDPFNSTPTGQRAIRGGNWVLPMAAARAAVRRGAPPDTRADTLGFRIARLSD